VKSIPACKWALLTAEHDAPTIYASKYYEIIKNGTLTRHSYNPLMIAMNKKSFEQIPPERVRAGGGERGNGLL
jgi:TRAP-type C4-dicarboxylate transport system substrate-binding protein